MLNIRRQILMALLNERTGLRSSELAKQVGVTQRTIRNNIEQINRNFGEMVVAYNKPCFYITDTTKVIKYVESKQYVNHYPEYTGDRPFLVYWELYQQRCVKLDALIDKLHVGRNEIERTIRHLKPILAPNLALVATKQGVALKGDQIWQDYYLAKLAVGRISRLVVNQYLRLIFGDNFNKDNFLNYLQNLDLQVSQQAGLKLNDASLYILTIMHFLGSKHEQVKNEFEDFQTEFILYSDNTILNLPHSQYALYQQLLELHSHHKRYLYNGLGNLDNHLKLASMHSKYFKLTTKKATIDNVVIDCTSQDDDFIAHLQYLADERLKHRIVIYHPDIKVLSHYQDQLLPIAHLFSDLDIQATTNLFELDELLHLPNEQIILTAEKERLSLTDQPYDIHFVKLNDETKFEIIRLLLKGTA